MRTRHLYTGVFLIALLFSGAAFAWFGSPEDPDEVAELLQPWFVVKKPDGKEPFPTALLLSGCDGPKDNLYKWAAALKDAGWASIIVDSHGPRGYDDLQIWRLICSGQLLPGDRRAGDLAVALDLVAKMEFVDPDRIAVIGASHGGWTALDLLALDAMGDIAPGLSEWPEPTALPSGRIAGIVALYPYCGRFSRVGDTGWEADTPVLFQLVDGDRIADEEDCLSLAGRMTRQGRSVEVQIFTGVTHGFDQQDKSLFSPLDYDASATAKAISDGIAFLDRVTGR